MSEDGDNEKSQNNSQRPPILQLGRKSNRSSQLAARSSNTSASDEEIELGRSLKVVSEEEHEDREDDMPSPRLSDTASDVARTPVSEARLATLPMPASPSPKLSPSSSPSSSPIMSSSAPLLSKLPRTPTRSTSEEADFAILQRVLRRSHANANNNSSTTPLLSRSVPTTPTTPTASNSTPNFMASPAPPTTTPTPYTMAPTSFFSPRLDSVSESDHSFVHNFMPLMGSEKVGQERDMDMPRFALAPLTESGSGNVSPVSEHFMTSDTAASAAAAAAMAAATAAASNSSSSESMSSFSAMELSLFSQQANIQPRESLLPQPQVPELLKIPSEESKVVPPTIEIVPAEKPPSRKFSNSQGGSGSPKRASFNDQAVSGKKKKNQIRRTRRLEPNPPPCRGARDSPNAGIELAIKIFSTSNQPCSWASL
eukprot:TRINITY_DN7775_c0_g1_i12.p1 TRINITY_DN7775_c0_g1~~TRINITY_DN7775_c0_g1_i12.p1  ORF type:complete len:426 (+),score=76.61 TRINITY_DN7775_c0_g1_i12:72-1349(+)